MLLESFQIAEAAIFVKEGVLVVITAVFLRFLCGISYKAGGRNELHVYLNSLTWVLHLLIRFRYVLGVWQLHRHLTPLSQKPIQPGNGSGVSSLPELDPEHYDPGVRVPAPHIVYELDFLWPVLIGMTVRTVGAILQRGQCPVVPFLPAIDVLPIGSIPDRRFRDSVFLCILNQCLPIPGGLCYLVHSE